MERYITMHQDAIDLIHRTAKYGHLFTDGNRPFVEIEKRKRISGTAFSVLCEGNQATLTRLEVYARGASDALSLCTKERQPEPQKKSPEQRKVGKVKA